MQTRLPYISRWSFPLLILVGTLVGCSEQPYGYIFIPQHRDEVNVARQATDFMSDIYDHLDQASVFLSDAGLTSNYPSILPDGWVDSTRYDGNGLPISPTFIFTRNYLDEETFLLTIPVAPIPGAVRTPARIGYGYVKVTSVMNNLTNKFRGQPSVVRSLDLSYSDNYSNPDFVNGWLSILKTVKFDQEIEVSNGGRSTKQTYAIYLSVPWEFRVEGFSIDPSDQRSRIIIDGLFPIMDENNIIQHPHVSGEFIMNSDGSGGGDLWLFGEPTARLTFTGRSFGFKGTFTLFSDDHKTTYNF